MSSKEVRTIDANALTEDVLNSFLKSDRVIETFIKHIQFAPTIDPESLLPHGRWKVVQINGTCTTFACSECSREVKATNDYFGKPTKHIAEKYPYCHCGAKMEVDNV